jgi:EAL domain-containing protein (putative c-di-GMP-specific phosphodiesterase class I)
MDEPNADVVRQLLGFVDKTSDLVGVVDANSRVVYLNEAARKRLGVGAASDLTTADVFPLEAFARYYEQVRPALLHSGRWEGELPVLTAAGDAVSMALSIVAGVGPGGEIAWLVTHGREIGSGGPSPPAHEELIDTVDAFARELALAVSHGRITPYVQPVVDLRSGQIVGYQGLARWQHPDRGLLAAGTFIDLVTDSAAAPVMDLAVLRDTAAVVARERRAGRRLRVYGHLSRRLLGDAELERYLVEIIEDLALTPEQFGAEIDRPLLVGSSHVLASVLRAVHDHGMRLVLTAPASDLELADAVQFGFDEVRLPPHLIAGIAEDAARARAVRSTITIAHGLGLLVTAVGVETEAVRDVLLDADCDLAAGELFGGPLPARDAGS